MKLSRSSFLTSSSSSLFLRARPSSFFTMTTTSKRFCATATTSNPVSKKQRGGAKQQQQQQQQEEETVEQMTARLRKETDREVYEPGVVAKALRSVVVFVTTNLGLRQRIANKMEKGLKEVSKLEEEAKWLRLHGSPLRVLGLPESADLEDVKARYRNLLFDVHPDTASKTDAQALISVGGLSPEKARERQLAEFELLQKAYKVATSPNSLWHQDGNAPLLLRELQPNQSLISRIVSPQNVFPLFAYIYCICVLFLIGGILGKRLLELFLVLIDPEFNEFMLAQEEEERRKRANGEIVDTDPKRLAPEKMLRIGAPGKFLTSMSRANVPDEDDVEFWRDE